MYKGSSPRPPNRVSNPIRSEKLSQPHVGVFGSRWPMDGDSVPGTPLSLSRRTDHTLTELLEDDQPPPPSVFEALRRSAGVTGSPSPSTATAGRIHVAHSRARLEELLGEEGGSPSAQCYAEAMCAELERGADPNELDGADDEDESDGDSGAPRLSVLQAVCTYWWTDGCDYDPRPVVAALLRYGADPHLRCDPISGPGAGFLRTEPTGPARRRGGPFHSQWAGHTALWHTCALSFLSTRVSSSSEERSWSPADAWLEAQRHTRSAEEREELAVVNRRRRSTWDAICTHTRPY